MIDAAPRGELSAPVSPSRRSSAVMWVPSVSSIARSIVFSSSRPATITVVQNWLEELKRLGPTT